MDDRYLLVGLGNPGRDYQKNRHNVGFQVLDYLANRHGLPYARKRNDAFIATGTMVGRQVILAKPQTYMNRSGRSVSGLMRFYKIPAERLLVVVDDLDLPVGALRLRGSGGSAGQKGMKDIIAHLGSEDFARLRVGIDRPPGRMDPADYVLQDFSKDQRAVIDETYSRAADAVESWLRDGIELAMSRHNGPAPE